MTTFEAYKTYLALRLHFTTNYDIRKTKGHVKAYTSTLDKNTKLQFYLQKLKKRYRQHEFVNYLVANFVSGDKWGGVYSADSDEVYLAWQATQDSLMYRYRQDLEAFEASGVTDLNQLFDCSTGHPIILKRLLGKMCLLETVVILEKLVIFKHEVDAKLINDPTWESVTALIDKYSLFVEVDLEAYAAITEKIFPSSN